MRQQLSDPALRLSRQAGVPGVEVNHRGRIKSLGAKARRLLKRRQAVEPVVGHLMKDDCGLRRNWLKASKGRCTAEGCWQWAGKWLMMKVVCDRWMSGA